MTDITTDTTVHSHSGYLCPDCGTDATIHPVHAVRANNWYGFHLRVTCETPTCDPSAQTHVFAHKHRIIDTDGLIAKHSSHDGYEVVDLDLILDDVFVSMELRIDYLLG